VSKAENVDDLLGGDAPAAAKKAPAKKAPAKKAEKPAKEEKPAKGKKEAKPAAKAPAKKAAAAEPVARTRTPIQFEEGERDKLYGKIEKQLPKIDKKKGINSRELAEKLGTETRKLRVCLYTMVGRGQVVLKSGESKVAGMMVHPA
jgi:hypothetical protein